MGGTHSTACNKVARDIWMWYIKKKIWLSGTHLNETADRLSRKFQDRTEWQLHPSVFKLLTKKWGRPEINYLPQGIIIKLSLLYHGVQTPKPMQLMQCV